MPAAAKRQLKEAEQRTLCRELLEIRRDNFAIFTRIEAINGRLKSIARDDGKIREVFDGLGHVSVSPPTDEQILGEAATLQIEAWQDLPESRRSKLIEQGLILMRSIIKKATYGQVRPKLYAEPEGED